MKKITIVAVAVLAGVFLFSGCSDSKVGDNTTSTPQFNPPAGTYSSDQSVVITSGMWGALICYTEDSSEPACNEAKDACSTGTLYSGVVSVAGDKTIKAIACKSGLIKSNSTVASAAYQIHYPGSLDTGFGTGGKVITAFGGDDVARAIAIDSGGKIVVAGYSWNGTNDFALARYNVDGSLDTTFDTDGKVTTPIGIGNDIAYAIAIDSGGKIVVAGNSNNGNNDFALARYNPADGSLDTTFDGGGKVTTPIGTGADGAYAIAIDSACKIVVAGYSYNGTNDFALARYNVDGSLDTTFGTSGKLTIAIGSNDDVAQAIAIDSNGKIVVAGYSSNGSNFDFALARYNPNGTLDTTFDSDGKLTTPIGTTTADVAFAMAIDSAGKIVVAGESNYDFALARYNVNGTLDTTFGTGGIVTTPIGSGADGANAMAIDSAGKIVVAGYSTNGNYDFALVRYNSNGSLDTTFDSDGKLTTPIGNSEDAANAIAIDSGGKIVVAGNSWNVSDNDFALARYWP